METFHKTKHPLTKFLVYQAHNCHVSLSDKLEKTLSPFLEIWSTRQPRGKSKTGVSGSCFPAKLNKNGNRNSKTVLYPDTFIPFQEARIAQWRIQSERDICTSFITSTETCHRPIFALPWSLQTFHIHFDFVLAFSRLRLGFPARIRRWP